MDDAYDNCEMIFLKFKPVDEDQNQFKKIVPFLKVELYYAVFLIFNFLL